MIGTNIASVSTFWDFHNFMVFEEFVFQVPSCAVWYQVGSRYKGPTCPIWVVCAEAQSNAVERLFPPKNRICCCKLNQNQICLVCSIILVYSAPFEELSVAILDHFWVAWRLPLPQLQGHHRQLPVSLHRSLFRRRCGESAGVRQGVDWNTWGIDAYELIHKS